MGLAAKRASPRRPASLPLLTPEYLTGIATFTRRYFEKLFDCLLSLRPSASAGAALTRVVVLDNYHHVPADSPFHEMIATGLDGVPGKVRVMVVSRIGTPASLVRLQAGGKLATIEYEDLRYTIDEVGELVRKTVPGLGDEAIRRIHEAAQGWAAGIVLMLERSGLHRASAETAGNFSYDGVFDYFAGEIFGGMEPAIRDFLLKTAVLPTLSVSLANRLTGNDSAERMLSTLHRDHLFTEKLSGSEREYVYHPLWREFLVNRAKMAYSSAELAGTRRQAALLLEEAGRVEDAVRLYSDAGDRDGIARIVKDRARELLTQGRNKTVEGWLAGIPEEPSDDPWLTYWRGMCFFPADMPRATRYLEQALKAFRADSDCLGIYLSWAGIADSHAFGLDDWQALDGCIALFEELTAAWPSFPSPETELLAASRMIVSLVLRKTDDPRRIDRWLERVSVLLEETSSFDIKMDAVFFMSIYFVWKGEYDRNAVLLERAEAEMRFRKTSPLGIIRVKLMLGIHCWITAEYDAAIGNLSEGLRIAAESGVHVFDSELWSFRAAAEMTRGHMERAAEALERQRVSVASGGKALDAYYYHVGAAWRALLEENPSLAAEHLHTISATTERMGTPYYRALWHIGMAQTEFLLDRPADAAMHLKAAQSIGSAMESPVLEWYAFLIDASLQLEQGRQAEGLLALRRGLSLGKRYGFVHLEFYRPAIMRVLFARALEENIEPEYVKGVIRKSALSPPVKAGLHHGPVFCPETWPFAVKIYTLGRFEIHIDGQPLVFSGKEQKKPLGLLKALIAFGASEVPQDRLTDELWPEADGDLAHKSFEMTLSRLRRLLFGEVRVLCRSRKVTLNPLNCWVDAVALSRLLNAMPDTPAKHIPLLCDRALALYRGEFLDTGDAPVCAVPRREVLKSRVLTLILAAGCFLEETGDWERAAGYFSRGSKSTIWRKNSTAA